MADQQSMRQQQHQDMLRLFHAQQQKQEQQIQSFQMTFLQQQQQQSQILMSLLSNVTNQKAIKGNLLLTSLYFLKDQSLVVLFGAHSVQIVMFLLIFFMADCWCLCFSVSSFFSLLMGAWSLLFSLMAVFASLNVNGLRDTGKREAFLQWLSHFSADFVALQETHAVAPHECQLWFSVAGFSSLVSVESVHSCGTVLLYRPMYTLVRSWSDDQGRFVMGEFSFHGVTFRVVSLYAPNRNPEREDFYASCIDRIDPAVPTVLCGDFNAVFNRTTDRRESVGIAVGRAVRLSFPFSMTAVWSMPGVPSILWLAHSLGCGQMVPRHLALILSVVHILGPIL